MVGFLLWFPGQLHSADAFVFPVDGAVYAMVIQPDGRIVLGGDFTMVDGQPRQHLARLHRDGTLDESFIPAADGTVYGLVVLGEGRLVVAGAFTNLAGVSRSRLGRLNSNGAIDGGFNPGADGTVLAVALQGDGKIVVGGDFTSLAGSARSWVGRLNGDGSADASFYAVAGGAVHTLALQPDGRILAGGRFDGLNGVEARRLCRLEVNGNLDQSFVASADDDVHALAVEADGRILAGGRFVYVNGQMHLGLARLHADGTPEAGFTASVRPGYLGDSDTIAIQSDGKFLVGGSAVGWFAFPYFARFHGDGSRDTNFTAEVPSGVHSIGIEREGSILHATFSTLGRMTNAAAVDVLSRFTATNTTFIIWERAGAGPEVWRTTFESSANGTNWTLLGSGTRGSGYWQWSGPSVATNAYIRARGYVASGYQNSSAWFLQRFLGPVFVVDGPASRTNAAGSTATFSVVADGTPALGYRWRKNGVNLPEGGNAFGVASSMLTLSNVLRADAAAYSVVVTNNFGSVTSILATLSVVDPFITSHPTNVLIDAGQPAQFTASAVGTAPLKYQWRKNGTNYPGATTSTLTLNSVPLADGGSAWRVVVTNGFGAVTSSVATLTVNGAIPDTLNPMPNYPVFSVAVQPDRKILLGGWFSWVGSYLRVGITRLLPDGSLDTNFAAGISGDPFSSAKPIVALQEDGRILIAGGITHANGVPRKQLARFYPDGTLDAGFNPGALGGDILAMRVQPDGKILLGGSFGSLAGAACNRIGRLNPDGSLDTNFVSGANGTVEELLVQPDGRIVVGGTFTSLGANGTSRTNLGRLNPDGTVDATFTAGADSTVNSLAPEADGGILVGGAFTSLGGQPRRYLGRLSPTGALDPAFDPGTGGKVISLAVQTDGRILLSGYLDAIGGEPRGSLGRLHADGKVDLTFNPGANGIVHTLAIQPDGMILAGGEFTAVASQSRLHLARLSNTGSASQSLTYNQSTATWMRTGSGPEVSSVYFDASTNGASFFRMPAVRVAGGWEATGPVLPAGATVRARGWLAGSGDGSAWLVENSAGRIAIDRQPTHLTNDAFTSATFEIVSAGEPPISYRWLRNGRPLVDGTNVAGAFSSVLTIPSTLGADAGDYQCIASNHFNSATSQVADFTVRDPLLTAHPAGINRNAGESAQFTVAGMGTGPLGCYWLKDGARLANGGDISGADTTTLRMDNLSGNSAGSYRAVLTNVWGSATSAVAVLTVADPLLVTNPVSQLVHRGNSVRFSVLVRGSEPLDYQWRQNGSRLPGATEPILAITNAQDFNAGAYDVVASNTYGSVTSLVATLTVNSAIAEAFEPGANGDVYAVARQPDGKLLLGGAFTSVAGQTRQRIARLNADGTLDTGFNPGAGGSVWCFAAQPDGRILVGGSFTSLAGRSLTNLARLNPDGSLDATFAPNPVHATSPNARVFTALPHSDGSILIGGTFSHVSGIYRPGIARLFLDGTVDTNFNAGVDGFVCSLAEQLDGRILVGGAFNVVNGEARAGLGRLYPNGTVDSSFTNVASSYIYALAEQPDGKILVGGWFSSLAGQTRSSIGRLNSDGSLDESFNPAPNNAVYSIRLHTDGRLIIGGFFGTVGGQTRGNLAKLTADGLVEPGFNPNANGTVYSLVGQPDGNFVIGGTFTSVAGQSRNRIARLVDTAVATESLVSDATTITWLRGGAAPEVARTTFETTTNGVDWTRLNTGIRIPGGWQVSGLTLPPSATIRARGFTTSGGFQSSSSWFVESIIGTPQISSQPTSRTNNATTTASFSVIGIDRLPTSFQWLKNGLPLISAANVSGANTSTLVLTNVLGADAGQYQVVLSNTWGSVTSAVAVLTVVDPWIAAQPAGQSLNAGQNVTFSVSAIGTPPLAYQWFLDGSAIPAATNSILGRTNVQAADAGPYTVVVSNQVGAVTSSPALLAVNLAVPDSFNPGSASIAGPFVLQPDGRIVIGGVFGNSLTRRYLARFNPDGSPDPAFIYSNVVADVSSTYCLALQTDDRLLGSGLGRQQLPTSLWRLNSDGTVDTSLTNQIGGSIYGLVLQSDGQIWAGGNFSYLKPSILTNLALVGFNGAVDTNLLTAVNSTIYALASQPDGHLLAGGNFTLVNGQPATRLARITSSGVLDTRFNASANYSVYSLVVQPDGRILVAGNFTTFNSSNINRLGRLNPDGSLDASFNPNVNSTVYSLALQVDGRIVIAGGFGSVSGQPRSRLARLNPDGSLDPTFNPTVAGGNAIVYGVGLQADGAVLVTGGFSQIAGQFRTNIARLSPTDPAVQSLTYNGTTLTWLRSGTAPEVWRTSFELSTNGASWTYLGAGQRLAGGWHLANVTLPPNAYVRARGFTTGCQNNGASWFVESALGPVLITSQPASRTNLAGTTATFWVAAGGTAPLTYQWLRNGQPLTDGGNLSGANSSSLVISNVLGGNMGRYSVIVGNSAGSVTSSEALLLVIEPIISTQPVSVFTNAGETASFSVTAIGTSPLTYQWYKDGINLPGATASSLVLSNAQQSDIGAYRVVVVSPFGGVPSQVANLNLNLALPDSFAPELNDEVRSLATQPDGKILIGGNFNHLGPEWFWEFGRLNADGSRDTNFNGHVNSAADTVAVQPDGNVLVGGWFTYANDWPHSRIARFFPDGALDPTVNPNITSSSLPPFIDSLVPQPDGKFLIGGWFTSIDGQQRTYIGRFNANGSLDSFNPGANAHVMMIALQPDGRIIAAGQFSTLAGQTRNRIGRLNPDGSLDANFNPNANNTVNSVVLQPDGKILVGGAFTSIGGQNRTYLARLNPDGNADPAFNVILNSSVSSLALQADGAIILAGSFTSVGGLPRSGLARVSDTGVVDLNWAPQIVGAVGGVSLQPNGKLLLCGSFSGVGGQPRSRLARFEAVGIAEHRLECDALGVTWLRGGSSPEISGTWFEISPDGTNWTNLGVVSRVPGGWRVNTSSLAINSYIRARGYHSGGRWNGSLSTIEDTTQVTAQTRPVILSDNDSFGFQTNQFGFTVRALPGQAIVIEATTDFLSWLPIQTNLVTDLAQFFFTDSQSGLFPHRYYRARVHSGPLQSERCGTWGAGNEHQSMPKAPQTPFIGQDACIRHGLFPRFHHHRKPASGAGELNQLSVSFGNWKYCV